MKLHEGEKIDSWDVVVRTTEGRELTLNDLHIDQLYHQTTHSIDDLIENYYPTTWTNEESEE